LSALNLEHLGSRGRKIKPEKSLRKNPPPLENTTDIFVAGKRAAFRQLTAALESDRVAETSKYIVRIESIEPPSVEDRLKSPLPPGDNVAAFEVVLHAGGAAMPVIEGFYRYLDVVGMAADLDRLRHVQGLSFVPVHGTGEQMRRLAEFSFLRAARIMPHIRSIFPSGPIRAVTPTRPNLPDDGPLDASFRVAIFDGGLSPMHPFGKWANAIDTPGVGPADPRLLKHGEAVTSAFLFGPVAGAVPVPPAGVDHYRVLDDTSFDPTGQYVDVLDRIVGVLEAQDYQYVNLSLGPSFPIDDDDVNLWTAKLDDIAQRKRALIVSAVGNDGDKGAGNDRIQAPSDAVNLLAVGAATTMGNGWQRADYSAVGPGRSPGIVKPDVVAFGGSSNEPFFAIDSTGIDSWTGTSFSTPFTLRLAAETRAHLGADISPLMSRALLIHHADDASHPVRQVGYGRILSDVAGAVFCAEDEVHVLYQGELLGGKFIRATIPTPTTFPSKGKVLLRATFCFLTETDAQDPSNYTRSGLEVIYRRDADDFGNPDDDRTTARSQTFFHAHRGGEQLRRDAHKWETAIHHEQKFVIGKVKKPVFDIHYHAREAGGIAPAGSRIPYALVLTMRVNGMTDLYDQIAQRYRGFLRALRPVIQIQVRA
jgi:subtilisin family serine protease